MIVGTIVEIDAAKHSLGVLTGRADDLKIQSFTIGKDIKAKVLFENQPIQEWTLAQLAKPISVTIRLGDDKTTVTGVVVQAPTTRGVLKAIDVAGKKITIVDSSREEKTFDLDADAVVRGTERRQGKLDDLTPRMNVVLALTPDRQRVIGVAVAAGRRDGDQPKR